MEIKIIVISLNSQYPNSLKPLNLQGFVENFAGNSIKLGYIQDFAISMFALKEFYCMT